MKLDELLASVPLEDRRVGNVEITGISYDTREMSPGCLFVALPGYKTDGHKYIDEALERGAAAVLCRRPPGREGPWRGAPAPRAARVRGRDGACPWRSLDALGTGAGAPRPLPPKAGSSVEKMQVHRLDGITFRAGIFTNLTQDHLDFHKTMEAYRQAKGLLFRQCEAAVLNLDDEAGRYYASTVPCPVFTYSERRDEADLTAKNLRLFPQRVEFEAVTMDAIARVRLAIPGGFTIYNALGALACGAVLGLPLTGCAAALAQAKGVKGRVEVVPVPAEFTVLIDYAHTPDALENVLTTVRDFTAGRVICLFGCGGDRDRSKRPKMGAIAGNLADVAVVTSDNPRTEDPVAIIQDILAGMEGTPAQRHVEPDRRKAIPLALSLAQPGDTVVLAGKGHETYQEINGVQYHLDEREEIAAWFAK